MVLNMFSNFYFPRKVVLFLIILHSVPALAVFSSGQTCYKGNSNSISLYFSGRSSSAKLQDFFNCTDSFIQLFLNHTSTGNPNYYTKLELTRFMQYMGAKETEAGKIAQAVLSIKTGFIGGRTDRLTKAEIRIAQRVLSIVGERMRALHSYMPNIVRILSQKNISRKQLIRTSSAINKNLETLARQLSMLPISPSLGVLRQLPQHFKVLGIINQQLKHWSPSMSILAQWKSIFLSSSDHIKKNEWVPLLRSFGHFTHLWFYHKKFLENKNWLHVNVIQHTQHFLSYSLDLIRKAQERAGHRNIPLIKIDELARRIDFVSPKLSEPVFRLGLRSVFCFILNPQDNSKTCDHSIELQESNVKINFFDLAFTIDNRKEILELKSGTANHQITSQHLKSLRSLLNKWIASENTLRRTLKIPDLLFGAPTQWLSRRLSVTPDSRLIFYANNSTNLPLMSHLNWQSHFMSLITSSYKRREGKELNQELWNQIVKEWTPFSVALYKDMGWSSFQKVGFQIFKHGDFLTSQSNGDGILQDEETLELFSLFMSALNTTLVSSEVMNHCRSSIPHYLHSKCSWNYLKQLTPYIFASFPELLKESGEKNTKYIQTLQRFKGIESPKELLSFKDLFEIFIFIHYQENLMESLDTNSSQTLQTAELLPILKPFAENLIQNVLFVHSRKDAFTFITYFFHYGDIPVIGSNKKISAPLRYSNWILKSGQWELEVDRADILRALLIMRKL